MEAYPQEYVAHNLPLLVLSGLPRGQNNKASSDSVSVAEKAPCIHSDLPSLSGPRAEQLLEEFMRTDGASLPWTDNVSAESPGLIGFRIDSIGRVGRITYRSLPQSLAC